MDDAAEIPGVPDLEALHRDARAIFAHALDACRIERAFGDRIRLEGDMLVLEPPPGEPAPGDPLRIDLGSYRRILIIALGKAAVPMTHSLLAILQRRQRVRGICAAPSRPVERDRRIRYYAGGHPLPNQNSFRAARSALRLLGRASEKTFVIYLISGGGSTLFELPLDPDISLEDTAAFHAALIASGATIHEINTLRKHFSAVKGGRLANAAALAPKLTLQVIDVPWRHMHAVASGPTLPDPSTVKDCRELIDRYHLLENFPASVQRFFHQPDLPETPKIQTAGLSGSLATLLSNHDLLLAAGAQATTLGYEVVIDNTCDDWPYDQAAAYLIDRLIELRKLHNGKGLCLLSGGEITVTIDRKPGTGGRNQHFVLACAQLLEQHFPGAQVVCLSAGSDGADGNSAAAGAIADPTTTARARNFGYNPEASLAAFDACPLFTALGDTVVTSPTGNNLRDLRILLSA